MYMNTDENDINKSKKNKKVSKQRNDKSAVYINA